MEQNQKEKVVKRRKTAGLRFQLNCCLSQAMLGLNSSSTVSIKIEQLQQTLGEYGI